MLCNIFSSKTQEWSIQLQWTAVAVAASGSLRRIQPNIWQRHKVWPVHTRSKIWEYPHIPPSYCCKSCLLYFCIYCNSSN